MTRLSTELYFRHWFLVDWIEDLVSIYPNVKTTFGPCKIQFSNQISPLQTRDSLGICHVFSTLSFQSNSRVCLVAVFSVDIILGKLSVQTRTDTDDNEFYFIGADGNLNDSAVMWSAYVNSYGKFLINQ